MNCAHVVDIAKEPISAADLADVSPVQWKILAELWPGDWVSLSKLLKLTGQKYFDRRIRELKDEHGFDIEAKNISGKWSYRLLSHSRRFKIRKRQYPNARERNAVTKRGGVKCSICGLIPLGGEVRGHLQFDHKIPFKERNGETTTNNLQLVCIKCNVLKRRACQVCPLTTCSKCPYAYPEKFGGVYAIGLSKKAKEKYEYLARKKGLKIEDVVQEKIEED